MHSAPLEVIIVALDTRTGKAESLSAAERARAARFRVESEGLRYVTAHCVLRELLAARTGVPPESLQLGCAPQGKPFLADCAVHFSLSRSAGLAAYAFTRAGAIGIDIEAIRPLEAAGAIAARAFPLSEQRAYAALPDAEKLPGFYQGWTRTEALAKALGGGLALAREALDAALEQGWVVRSFAPAPSFAGAVAYRSGEAR